MLGAELIAAFRDDAGDTNEPYGWGNDEVLRWLNEGHTEAARRARLLVDSTTVAVCQATITAGDPLVTLDPRVVFVRRARIQGESLTLIRARVRDLDRDFPGWDADISQETPRIYVPDYQTDKLRLVKTPVASGVLLMTVVREPLAPIALDTSPEIPARTHEALIHWIKHRAYLKEDEDLKDEALSKKALALFELEFGTKSPVYDERWIADNYDADEGGLY